MMIYVLFTEKDKENKKSSQMKSKFRYKFNEYALNGVIIVGMSVISMRKMPKIKSNKK